MKRNALTRDQILGFLGDHRELLRSMGVRRLALFGSVARGDQTPASDLDFLVEFETKSFDAYMDLKFFLEENLESPVDLILADALKPRLRPAILAEARYAPGL